MNIDIELLKKIDWWNDSSAEFGNVSIDIRDSLTKLSNEFGKNPWDIAYNNITKDLYGSFPISMQIGYQESLETKIAQKYRIVNISYDPHFPPIEDDEEVAQPIDKPITKKVGRKKNGI